MENSPLSHQVFFTVGSQPPAMPIPPSGNWNLIPSKEGWKLEGRGQAEDVAEESRIFLGGKGLDGIIYLVPSDPKKTAFEFDAPQELAANIGYICTAFSAINSAIVRLALDGHALANINIGITDGKKIRMELTSTEPFGVGKSLAEIQQEGTLA